MCRGGSTGRQEGPAPWRCPISPCASCSKPASISATTPAAGTRRWRPTSSACATRSTSSTCSRPCRCCDRALQAVRDVVAGGGRVLFVGTKRAGAGARRRGRQALRPVLRQPPLARRHADQLEDHLRLDQAAARARGAARAATSSGLTKKELLDLTRDRDKLERALGGIKEMGGLPDILFVIDTNKEAIAVAGGQQAAASRSSRSSTATPIPTASTYPIPGNDDAIRAITLYCDLVAGAVLDGISAEMAGLRRRCRRAASELPAEDAPVAAEAGRGRGSPAEAGRRSSARPRPAERCRSVETDPLVHETERDMAEITAALVKDLREKTGAGMMDCKKALGEAGGDIGSRDRLAAQEGPGRGGQEGRPRRRRGPGRRRRQRHRRGAVVEVNAETDFVARNEHVPGVRRATVAEARARRSATTSRRSRRRRIPAPAATWPSELTQLVATIGENMNLRRAAC